MGGAVLTLQFWHLQQSVDRVGLQDVQAGQGDTGQGRALDSRANSVSRTAARLFPVAVTRCIVVREDFTEYSFSVDQLKWKTSRGS